MSGQWVGQGEGPPVVEVGVRPRRPASDRLRPASLRSELVEALLATGGNLARAARLVGIPRATASTMARTDPEVRAAVERAQEEAARQAAKTLRPWIELAERAQAALLEALAAERTGAGPDGRPVSLGPDHRVRIQAAREILDRALGKPVARVEGDLVHREAPQLDAETAHRAMAVSLVRGLSAVEAVEWVRDHPDEADRILTAFRALAAGEGDSEGETTAQDGREGA